MRESHQQFEMADSADVSGVTQRSPITISLLFYVVTVGAILSACLRTLVGNESLTRASIGGLMIAGAALGLTLGTILGRFGLNSYTSAGICAPVGIVVGLIAGGLAAVEPDSFREISLISFGGCWLLIATMLFAAKTRRR